MALSFTSTFFGSVYEISINFRCVFVWIRDVDFREFGVSHFYVQFFFLAFHFTVYSVLALQLTRFYQVKAHWMVLFFSFSVQLFEFNLLRVSFFLRLWKTVSSSWKHNSDTFSKWKREKKKLNVKMIRQL